jgi:hypothetical protein
LSQQAVERGKPRLTVWTKGLTELMLQPLAKFRGVRLNKTGELEQRIDIRQEQQVVPVIRPLNHLL